MTDIINISYTVNPKVAQGRERFKNIITGEEWWGNDPNEPELDFTPHFEALTLPDADISEEPVAPPKPKAKPKAKK